MQFTSNGGKVDRTSVGSVFSVAFKVSGFFHASTKIPSEVVIRISKVHELIRVWASYLYYPLSPASINSRSNYF